MRTEVSQYLHFSSKPFQSTQPGLVQVWLLGKFSEYSHQELPVKTLQIFIRINYSAEKYISTFVSLQKYPSAPLHWVWLLSPDWSWVLRILRCEVDRCGEGTWPDIMWDCWDELDTLFVLTTPHHHHNIQSVYLSENGGKLSACHIWCEIFAGIILNYEIFVKS